MTKRVLVTGKNGQLGRSLQKLVTQNSELSVKNAFIFVGRNELDLSSSASIEAYFSDKHFDTIINCAAYTAVDQAESNPELADQINHLAVAQLAEISKQQDIALIHISTDYVFNGQSFKPYLEADATDPQNVYGSTKLKGEQAMQASGCAGAIIRTSWVYSEFGNNFVKTMLRLGKERESLNVIFDQIGSPTYATDLAHAILTIIGYSEFISESLTSSEMLKQVQHDGGVEIYHYSNEGVCSWYDFAKAIFEFSNVECAVAPIETKDYPTPVARPYYSLMNKAKIKQSYGLEIPYWWDALKTCLKELEK